MFKKPINFNYRFPIGHVFNKGTIVGFKYNRAQFVCYYLIECHDCNEINVRFHFRIGEGYTLQCSACLKTVKEMISDKKLRAMWKARYHAMMRRCYEPTDKDYDRYGRRGLTVQSEWHTFAGFVKDLVTLPGWDDPKLELDRRENSRGYYRDNVRMITDAGQAWNRDNTIFLEYRGLRYPAKVFQRMFCPGFRDNTTVWRHAKHGFNAEAILEIYERYLQKNASRNRHRN